VLICQVKRTMRFKCLILLQFPMCGAIPYADGGGHVLMVLVRFEGVVVFANNASMSPPGEALGENAVPSGMN